MEYNLEFFNEKNGSSYWELYKSLNELPFYTCGNDEIFSCKEWHFHNKSNVSNVNANVNNVKCRISLFTILIIVFVFVFGIYLIIRNFKKERSILIEYAKNGKKTETKASQTLSSIFEF